MSNFSVSLNWPVIEPFVKYIQKTILLFATFYICDIVKDSFIKSISVTRCISQGSTEKQSQ